ncbi:MAG: hypothetical protein J0H73_05870 [Salana multivorans]|uniref:hypothetical protein n=1 Tax=Salana multivorans TaxID=120377 RepID=UPI000961352D|nr:hypothetical protein [Salana multivorans]MBN8881826.1 hypothetical protein [Salana multivorans]OJX97833.1 MAG: hypothetical protein BGO96_12970 [Micrococcales bacterium 73-15]
MVDGARGSLKVDGDLQLISDGDGLAVVGDRATVDLFLSSAGLASRDLGLSRLLSAAGVVARGAESVGLHGYGRWVKLTAESARLRETVGLMRDSRTGLDMGIIHAGKGHPRGIGGPVRFESAPGVRGLADLFTNPAVLAGAAGIMAQLAMQQTMDEILDYLAVIDEKVDDILRAQKDAALSDMIGAGFLIEEAMTVRRHVGRVSETTWSKVQGSAASIATTQVYALRRLDALAEKLERKSQPGDLAKAAKGVELEVREWLAVLARCFQLQDALAVLELDRVLDAVPEELERHRSGLRAARRSRLEVISVTTLHLLDRLHATAVSANEKALLHPLVAKSVVVSRNRVAREVVAFHDLLGIERGREDLDVRGWLEAAVDVRDKMLQVGTDGVQIALRLGDETRDRATRAAQAFRPLDLDGDGLPDRPRALSVVEDAGSAIKDATAGAADAVGALLRRGRRTESTIDHSESDPTDE